MRFPLRVQCRLTGASAAPIVVPSSLHLNRRLNTRLVIVHYTAGESKHLLGLIAERATETMRRDPKDFQDSGVTSASPPHLGPVALDSAGPVHWIDVDRLLPALLADALFQPAVNA